MRTSTARDIVHAYNHWRETRPSSQDARAAKEELDEKIRQAAREEFIERAHVVLDLPFHFIGAAELWPNPGESSAQPLPSLLK